MTPVFYKHATESAIPSNPIRELHVTGEYEAPKIVTELVDEFAEARKKHVEQESLQTLEKLSRIITDYPQSIFENRDVLAKIIEKLDEETRNLVLTCPLVEFQNLSPVIVKVQKQIYGLLIENYIENEPLVMTMIT